MQNLRFPNLYKFTPLFLSLQLASLQLASLQRENPSIMDFVTILDYIGTFAFAISGVRLAARKNFDIFGAYVVGFVTAVGGGTIRDLMLLETPFWMLRPSYVVITGIALGVAIVFKRWLVRLSYTFFIFDAIGLGLFTVVGIEKTLAGGFPMWVAMIMGCITGAAGGMLRDIFINEIPLIFRKDIYAMASVGGGIFFWILTMIGIPELIIQSSTALVVMLTRVLCVHFHINLPSLKGDGQASNNNESNLSN